MPRNARFYQVFRTFYFCKCKLHNWHMKCLPYLYFRFASLSNIIILIIILEDYIDKVTGETIKGLRKYGPSKEHRPNPIVEMGLFMDRDGIPLSMCITSGSDNEQTTAIPLEKNLQRCLKGKNSFTVRMPDLVH